ncbi:hypothetical protein ACT17Q_13370 [Cellulomonas sp. CW35]|uniref:hypothetical protein n=1 Tax=Cellulomonas sp. CW35 TaxID=3458249 RepID=UPI0040348243
MSSQDPRPRRPRRAVRPPGTVGTDESVLRSTLPAAPAATTAPAVSPAASPGAGPRSGGAGDRSGDALLALRSADDSDVGWGEGADANDERLRRDKPPHW